MKTLELINAAVESGAQRLPRPHLGASLIGKTCLRELWYRFRWVKVDSFDARMLRLFDRGQREEAVFCKLLRDAGFKVVEEQGGKQISFSEFNGHFSGSLDGVVFDLPENPKKWTLLEFKTHNDKSFKALSSKGVRESKPEHFAQMQTYMRWGKMEKALYCAVNKNTDELHLEIVEFDDGFADDMVKKAQMVIEAATPPVGISNDPAEFACKWCPMAGVCHGTEMALAHCRTCVHATPDREIGGWKCEKRSMHLSLENQFKGCDQHMFIPDFLDKIGEPVDACADGEWIEYKMLNGQRMKNGPKGLLSSEIVAASKLNQPEQMAQLFSDQTVDMIKQTFNGRLV